MIVALWLCCIFIELLSHFANNYWFCCYFCKLSHLSNMSRSQTESRCVRRRHECRVQRSRTLCMWLLLVVIVAKCTEEVWQTNLVRHSYHTYTPTHITCGCETERTFLCAAYYNICYKIGNNQLPKWSHTCASQQCVAVMSGNNSCVKWCVVQYMNNGCHHTAYPIS